MSSEIEKPISDYDKTERISPIRKFTFNYTIPGFNRSYGWRDPIETQWEVRKWQLPREIQKKLPPLPFRTKEGKEMPRYWSLMEGKIIKFNSTDKVFSPEEFSHQNPLFLSSDGRLIATLERIPYVTARGKKVRSGTEQVPYLKELNKDQNQLLYDKDTLEIIGKIISAVSSLENANPQILHEIVLSTFRKEKLEQETKKKRK